MKQISSLLPGCAISLTTTSDGVYPQYANANEAGRYIESLGLTAGQSTLVRMAYDRETYTTYRSAFKTDGGAITREQTVTSDGVATDVRGLTLILPLGDCIGAVLYDPAMQIVMLSHLGRHNLEQSGGLKSIEFMKQTYKCDPATIHVWLSPAAGAANYPLYAFDQKGLHEVAVEQLVLAGVDEHSIVRDTSDTTIDDQFYSHSEYLKGNRLNDDRFIVAATLTV